MDSLHERRMKWIEKERARLQRNELMYIVVSSICMGYVAGTLVRNFLVYMGWM
jgi:hypothetical protein